MSRVETRSLAPEAEGAAEARPLGVIASVAPGRVIAALSASFAQEEGVTIGTLLRIDGEPAAVAVVTGIEAPAADIDAEAFDVVLAEAELVGRIGAGGLVESRIHCPTVGVRTSRLDTAAALAAREAGLRLAVPIGEADGPFSIEADRILSEGVSIVGPDLASARAMAVTVRSLLKRGFPARLVLVDPDNLFTRSFGNAASIVDASAGFIAPGLLTADELADCLEAVGDPLSREDLRLLKAVMRGQGGTLRDLIGDLEREREQGAPGTGAACASVVRRLRAAREDARLAPVFGEDADHLSPDDLLQRLFRLPDGSPPMAVCQLGGCEAALQPVLTRIILRLSRTLARSTEGRIPVLMAVHGADRLLGEDDDTEPSGSFAVLSAGREPLIAGVTLYHAAAKVRDDAVAAQLKQLDGADLLAFDWELPWPQALTLTPLPESAQPRPLTTAAGERDVHALIDAARSAFAATS
ncbi:hypothetical protein HK107_03025 [Parvularcula sp. ZS-1/3]|uniref:Uncharacterized protein n=1 Tax=Parvularcula mediterranea TaxID=2732508 RepID=A0A7Y3RL13_9PROT|nr:hypothetical protein [Parvularcula mediterranea]NNU15297.1 hypothetical protein [Parvularcula mediterranea]